MESELRNLKLDGTSAFRRSGAVPLFYFFLLFRCNNFVPLDGSRFYFWLMGVAGVVGRLTYCS